MIFFEEHLWGTASAITTNICLTKDWNKNKIKYVLQLRQAFGKLFRKICHKIKKIFKKVFDQSTNSGL